MKNMTWWNSGERRHRSDGFVAFCTEQSITDNLTVDHVRIVYRAETISKSTEEIELTRYQ